jgi:hypothetical protein
MDEYVGEIYEDLLVICGDLKGHVGKDRIVFEEVMGIYEYGEKIDDTENILDFCQGHRITVVVQQYKWCG